MGAGRASKCAFSAGAIYLLIFLFGSAPAFARVIPPGFAIPAKMLPIGKAVTPREYSELLPVIKAYWELNKAKELQVGPGLGPHFSGITATRVRLGALGDGFVVSFDHSPECGNGGCPMALLVSEPKGYHLSIMAGGWGYALLPSGDSVPDIAFYWNGGGGDTPAQLFHYEHGNFVARHGLNCAGSSNSNAVCSGMSQRFSQAWTISPAQYNTLRPTIEASVRNAPHAFDPDLSFENAHAINVYRRRGVRATAVALGRCSFITNCTISIYGHDEDGRNVWTLLSNVSGWGLAQSSLENVFGGFRLAFVIASRVSPNEGELRRYSVPLVGHFVDLEPGSRLAPDACEIVTPKSGDWPAKWNAVELAARPVSCFKTAAPAQAQIPVADTTRISAAVQDGDGTVWAIGSGFSSQLYRWRDGEWRETPAPKLASTSGPGQAPEQMANGPAFEPRGLWRGANGGVVTLWSTSGQNSELVWRRGDQSRIVGLLPAVGPPNMPESLSVQTVAAARLGTIVITENGGAPSGSGIRGSNPAVFRVDSNRSLQRIYAFTRDQFLPRPPNVALRRRLPPFPPFQTTRDGQGQIWIWSRSERPMWRGEALEGFVVTDGQTAKNLQQIPGLPDARLTSVSLWDRHHLAAVVLSGGVYLINTTTFEAHQLPEPRPGAFRSVEKVFHAGSDDYVLAAPPPGIEPVSPGTQNSAPGKVWRCRDGHWSLILQADGLSGVALAARDGLWVGTSDFRGLWLIPTRGEPRRVDYQQGFPLSSVSKLFELPEGDLFATDAGDFAAVRSVEYPRDLLQQHTGPPTPFSVVYPLTDFVLDSHHNIWGLLNSGRLGEWNGERWIEHPLPPSVHPAAINGVDVDARGQVWLLPDCKLGAMAIFDPAVGRWTAYQDYRDALTHSVNPVKFLHHHNCCMSPIYGPNSQIVFVGECRGVNYFNGKSWRQWNSWELPGSLRPGELPFFDAAGRLAIDPQPRVTRRMMGPRRPGWRTPTTWEWTPDSQWRVTSYEPAKSVIRFNPFTPTPPTPRGCETMLPSSWVKDTSGRMWWIAGDALYEGVGDQCRTVLSASAPQPFIDGRRLVGVVLDGRGNVFLETQTPFSYVLIRSSEYGGAGGGN